MSEKKADPTKEAEPRVAPEPASPPGQEAVPAPQLPQPGMDPHTRVIKNPT